MTGPFVDAADSLAEVYQRANDRIRSFAENHGQAGAVGTTLVSFIATDSRYLIMNIGDSRGYRISSPGAPDAIEQITIDHIVANELVQQGAMAENDYPSSSLRNQLTKCLGPKMRSEPDIFPDTGFGMLPPGATVLLCSDGFYSELQSSDFARLRTAHSNLKFTLEQLASEALARGTTDNLSAVVLRYSE